MSTSCEIALRGMPKNSFDDKLTLVQVMAWCHPDLCHPVVQSTPVISRLLGAKIREHELSGSPVISRERKAQTRDFQDQSPTL